MSLKNVLEDRVKIGYGAYVPDVIPLHNIYFPSNNDCYSLSRIDHG